MTICTDPPRRSADPPGTATQVLPSSPHAPGLSEAAKTEFPLNPALLRRTRSKVPASAACFRCVSHFAEFTKPDLCIPRILHEDSGYLATKPPEPVDMNEAFNPKFDSQGLLSAVVIDAASSRVLMVAFMDAGALEATRRTGFAHFHSRSRGRLWKKGESSGNVLAVEEILVDCDQDALVLRCRPAGPTCHTGAASCFYRRLSSDGLETISG